MKPLLTPKQAMEVLAIGSRKLWELTNRGEIPHLRIGRSIRYVPEDLERWIQQQKERVRPGHEWTQPRPRSSCPGPEGDLRRADVIASEEVG